MSDSRPDSRELRVVLRPAAGDRSPYRLVRARGEEILLANEFLDATLVRGLSRQTLRTYAYSLLKICQWLAQSPFSLEQITESHLAGFLRYCRQGRTPAPRSLNLRLAVLRALYRFHTGHELPTGKKALQEPVPFWQPHLGPSSRRRFRRPALRVKVPERLLVPLTRREVLRFFESLRCWRDLALASLMLFGGLRSREVLVLQSSDLDRVQEKLRVRGKGNKDRVLPLAPYAGRTLSSYLRLERPETDHDTVFVSLKGRSRGRPMTPAGLREVFRYHRRSSGVAKGNPHRFRHTFASDMVRAGVSLPALMRLMGHTQIRMTMRYVNLSAEDVREEFERAVRRYAEPSPDGTAPRPSHGALPPSSGDDPAPGDRRALPPAP